nr:MAG TPA: hypothetical protein [Caudoviricetes sp.]
MFHYLDYFYFFIIHHLSHISIGGENLCQR